MVDFAPTSPTGSNATLLLVYDDGSGAASASRAVKGSGASRAVLVVQDFDVTNLGAAWDFGTRGIGAPPVEHNFYVINTGGATAGSLTAPAIGAGFAYKGGAYPGSGGSCGATLLAGASCQVVVVFSPVAAGPATGSVTVNYDDGAAAASAGRAVKGVGTAAGLLEIDEDSDHNNGLVTSFGAVGIGSSADRKLMVLNIGASPVSAMSFAPPAAPFAYVAGGGCGTTLAVGASCALIVRFAPVAGGDFSASAAVTYDDGSGGPRAGAARALSGHGVDGALLAITDWPDGGDSGGNPFQYGTWGIPVDHAFTVMNVGNKTATSMAGIAPAAPFSWKGGTYPGAGGTCSLTLAAGASCTIVVTFSGASTASSSVGISYADGSGHVLSASRDITGQAAQNAFLTIADCNQCGTDSQPADFGTAGRPVRRVFYLSNTGARTATAVADAGLLGGAFAWTGGSYPGTGANCGSTLDPGASCTLDVTFSPGGGTGNFAGTLGVTYADGAGGGGTATRALAGAGTNAALLTVRDWSETSTSGSDAFDFGVAGFPIDHTFFITNDGAQAASMMVSGGAMGGGFDWKGAAYPGGGGTCGAALASGAFCTVVVTFSPGGGPTGPRGGALSIRYFDGNGTAYAARKLAGTATDRALLVITDWDKQGSVGQNPAPFDYGTAGVPVEHTFTVTNTGAVVATQVADGLTLQSPFGWTNGAPFGGGDCPASLGPRESCTVSVTFKPTDDGPHASTLSLSYLDGVASAAAVRALTGTATTKAVVTITDWSSAPPPGSSPPPYDFGVWGFAVDHAFTVRNDGGGPATLLADGGAMGTGFAWRGGSYPGTNGGDCGSTLLAGATCTVVVRYTPSDLAPQSGQVRITHYDGAATRTATRSMIATPTPRAYLYLSEYFGPSNCTGCGPYDFGVTPVGTPLEHVFTLTNTGALAATGIASDGSIAGPFSFKGPSGYPGTGGDCGAMLPSGSSCSLVLVFTPGAAGTFYGMAGARYDDTTMSPLAATRALQGTGQ
jgi:hypothetical protein